MTFPDTQNSLIIPSVFQDARHHERQERSPPVCRCARALWCLKATCDAEPQPAAPRPAPLEMTIHRFARRRCWNLKQSPRFATRAPSACPATSPATSPARGRESERGEGGHLHVTIGSRAAANRVHYSTWLRGPVQAKPTKRAQLGLMTMASLSVCCLSSLGQWQLNSSSTAASS